jgi:nucleoside 2-deoxyribosyltransferase
MRRILVAGGFDDNDPRRAEIERFCKALGEAIAIQGHTYLNGCQTWFDGLVAKATYEKLLELKDPNPDRRVISYLLADQKPIHEYGTAVRSRLTDWEIDKAYLYVPEQIQLADAVILVGGFEGTFRAANWSRISKKPLLPVAYFGNASAKIFEQEINEFERRYADRLDKLDYQELNSVKTDWEVRASKIVALAERLASSNTVCVVMSYSGRADLEDAYESFQAVCDGFKYKCERVDNTNTVDRIVPRIHEKIEQAAFVIVDVSELRTNVFYELGFAQGLRKPIIITAKVGTELPFDVKDLPTIFWEGQKKLKEDLRAKIVLIAETQGR